MFCTSIVRSARVCHRKKSAYDRSIEPTYIFIFRGVVSLNAVVGMVYTYHHPSVSRKANSGAAGNDPEKRAACEAAFGKWEAQKAKEIRLHRKKLKKLLESEQERKAGMDNEIAILKARRIAGLNSGASVASQRTRGEVIAPESNCTCVGR